ncbi:MAG: heparan N-sulfatase, partial [Deltaproteobacteria bacterium]
LDESGELDNTLVIVTADNGMPFPRVKSHAYEFSNHLPLAIMWKNGINKPGRVVDDFVSFIDFAPTFLELANIEESESGMQPVTGKSLTDIFFSGKSGSVDKERDHILIGKERHDVGRPHDWGYPIRGIVRGDYLYIKNFEPSRWPACDPETGYLNTDGGPTKTQCIAAKKSPETVHYWQLTLGKRPGEELFNIKEDPACINNLAFESEFSEIKASLNEQLMSELKKQGDPRMTGNGNIFDEYVYADDRTRNFYERYMSGELNRAMAGWVNETDFEK